MSSPIVSISPSGEVSLRRDVTGENIATLTEQDVADLIVSLSEAARISRRIQSGETPEQAMRSEGLCNTGEVAAREATARPRAAGKSRFTRYGKRGA